MQISSPLFRLDEVAVRGLAGVVDLLLPGTDVLPAGSTVGAHTELLERALNADPRLQPAVAEFARWAERAEPADLDAVLAWDPTRIESVVFALTASYYMSSVVKKALDYPGQMRRPVADATPDQRVSAELLAPVLDRGPIYVPVDDIDE